MKKQLLVLFLSVLTLVSCSDDNNNSSGEKTGTLTGKVTTINTHKAVGGALVFAFDDDHNIYHTYTNATGDFELDAPIGDREVYIQTGDGSNFRTKIDVVVEENQTKQLEESLLRLDQVARIAYVSGNYDSIEDIITSLGYVAESITFSQLSDYNIVSEYDIIFLNCGSISGGIWNNATVTTNLAKFVTNGGSLYASDWAVAYLIGGSRYSTMCGDAGGFISDATLCSTNTGNMGTLNASITNTALANAIGLSTLDIEYDLGSWQKIISVDETFWEVLVRDSTTNEALMIKTNSFFDSSLVGNPVGNPQNSDWITICHQPDENSSTPITITIDASSWPAHQAHGDTLGSCTGTGTGGTIYYTTFHNHANENIGNSQLILEHVILNL
ncbi:carboxypeptidase regulatory-like domain-containing protein [Flavobacterium sp. IMCC34852]|uniref:Carboxypeptidase regulatory-like domain-containing protein n=1 Tax=Flavobacterium rivulicola TaxID=2732161 RepID=A0A7Y3R749_9FLAO|nr:carboxypeptidase-like regulatory domain-containing protein [Flavobacterium sp. IMCC34852]NNT71173.1 carboxypeptidase regulatory-like domain-containing protein [Flavobacterium sp. IMCC34852]